MKFDRSTLLTILYSLFTILYTLYIVTHLTPFRSHGAHPVMTAHPARNWWYFLEFLLFGNLAFFILQGIILKSTNWGVLLLLPLANIIALILLTYLFVFIIRWGKGDLLDRDAPDMILAAIILLGLSLFSMRYIIPHGNRKTKKPRKTTR